MRNVLMIFVLGLFVFKSKCVAQKVNPPGTIWLRDNLFIDAAPLENIHYREYEYLMRLIKFNLDSFQQIVATLPYFGFNRRKFLDSLNIAPNADSSNYKINQDASLSWNKPLDFKVYLNHPSYNFYPIVNTSYDLVLKFCAWRTAMVQLLYSEAATNKERQKHYKKIKYRLATKEEWEFAIRKVTSSKKIRKLDGVLPPTNNRFTIMALSEMVAEKDIVKGCSWKQKDCKQNVSATFENKAPADWITFRCICEVED